MDQQKNILFAWHIIFSAPYFHILWAWLSITTLWHARSGPGVPFSSLDCILGCLFTRKASASSGLIQNLEPNWLLFGKMSIFNEDFGSLMPSLSLTLNVEPWTCERLRGNLQKGSLHNYRFRVYKYTRYDNHLHKVTTRPRSSVDRAMDS